MPVLNLTFGSNSQPGTLYVLNGQVWAYQGNDTTTDPTILAGQLVGTRLLGLVTVGGSFVVPNGAGWVYVPPLSLTVAIPTGVRMVKLSLHIPEYVPDSQGRLDYVSILRGTPSTILTPFTGVIQSYVASSTAVVPETRAVSFSAYTAVTPGTTDNFLVACTNDQSATSANTATQFLSAGATSLGSFSGANKMTFAVEIA